MLNLVLHTLSLCVNLYEVIKNTGLCDIYTPICNLSDDGLQKVLLILHFDCCSFMMVYLLDIKQVHHIKTVFNNLEQAITFSLQRLPKYRIPLLIIN